MDDSVGEIVASERLADLFRHFAKVSLRVNFDFGTVGDGIDVSALIVRPGSIGVNTSRNFLTVSWLDGNSSRACAGH